jgi:hypothetical protein
LCCCQRMGSALEELARALSMIVAGKQVAMSVPGQREVVDDPFEQAAELVGRRTLTPWAEAAFANRVADRLKVDLVDVKAATPTLLECLAKGLTEDELASRGFAPSLVRAAVSYAGWLALEAAREERTRLSVNRVVSDRLPPRDADAAERFLIYKAGVTSKESIDTLYARWVRLVGEVESEYSALYEEYCNELDARDLLEEASTYVSRAGRRVLDDLVEPVDERFLRATEPREEAILATARWRPRRWWWYRQPRRPGPAMRRYLDNVE